MARVKAPPKIMADEEDSYTDDPEHVTKPEEAPAEEPDSADADEEPEPPARVVKKAAAAPKKASAPAKASSKKAPRELVEVVVPKTKPKPEPVAANGRVAPKPVRGRDKLGSYYRSGRTGQKCHYTPGDYDDRERAVSEAIRTSGYD
jgi:hypothetical protein